jgi:hypothetical protein
MKRKRFAIIDTILLKPFSEPFMTGAAAPIDGSLGAILRR